MKNPPPKHVMTLMKSDGHKYVFIYESGHESELAHLLDSFSTRSDLTFSKRDAVVMKDAARRTTGSTC